jgi:hypothetical protein
VRSELGIPSLVLGLAAVYTAAHLAFLAPSLEDIDSINFALGLRHFDVASHQPHPPGYPVYIALGHLSKTVVEVLAPSLAMVRVEAVALAIWSAIGGGIALLAAFSIFSSLDRAGSASGAAHVAGFRSTAMWATVLLAAAPLFWVAGSRPMSDIPGLAMAMLAQALILRSSTKRSLLVAGALVAGLAAGVRVQTACLTLPLLVLAMVEERRSGVWWLVSRPLAALAVGGVVWVVPLLVLSGGLDGYLRALSSQAGEDLAWAGMLWTDPTPRRLLFALWNTFVLPWDASALGIVVGALAVAGAVVALLRHRRAALLITLAFAPYVGFHLLLQETIHTRYAMPTLPAMVWLAVCATSLAGRLSPVINGLVVLVTLVLAVPVGIAYGREPHPAFRAIDAMRTSATAALPAAVYSHYAVRRALQAADLGSLRVVEPRRNFEWLGLVDYWRGGGRAPIWFLADPRRTDLALIDPQSRRDVTHFQWSVVDRPEFSGTRPMDVDWYRFDRPGWFAGEGWALTPETGGIAHAAGTGVDRRPIEAWVRRRSGPMHLLIGGRHFSAAGDPPAIVELSIDGTPSETWKVDPGPGGASFLRFADLAAGLPPGSEEYARLTISARAEPAGRPTPQIAIRQFDIQPAGTLIFGFGEGWHEEEYDNVTGVRWRWTSGRSVLRVSPPEAIVLTFRGESPLQYFDVPPIVRVSADSRVVDEFRPDADFERRVTVPADAVRSGGGAIVIETDRIYLPGQAEGTADPRRLGLRLFEIRVHPVAP